MKKHNYFLLLVWCVFFVSRAMDKYVKIKGPIKIKNIENAEVVIGQKTSGIYSYLKHKHSNSNFRNKDNSSGQRHTRNAQNYKRL